jgi:hypothetical protein
VSSYAFGRLRWLRAALQRHISCMCFVALLGGSYLLLHRLQQCDFLVKYFPCVSGAVIATPQRGLRVLFGGAALHVCYSHFGSYKGPRPLGSK